MAVATSDTVAPFCWLRTCRTSSPRSSARMGRVEVIWFQYPGLTNRRMMVVNEPAQSKSNRHLLHPVTNPLQPLVREPGAPSRQPGGRAVRMVLACGVCVAPNDPGNRRKRGAPIPGKLAG